MNVINYFDNLICRYNCSNNEKEKEVILSDIQNLLFSLKFGYKNNKDLSKMYINFLYSINEDKEFSGFETYNDLDKKIEDANNELRHLKDILKYLKTDNSICNYNINFGTEEQFKNYISSYKPFFEFYKRKKYDVIIDNDLNIDCVIKLKNRFLMCLIDRNISSLIHELVHIYNKCSFDKFNETIPVLSEMAITKKLELSNNINRLDDISSLKSISNNGINDICDLNIFYYGIASLISIPFLDKNGTNFNNIMRFNDYLLCNKDISLEKVFKYLNIKERDIINSVNNIDKVLSLK